MFRRRGLGGSTAIWGGRLATFDPIDLAPRPWLDLPAWPVSYAEIAQFYPQARVLCGGGETYATDAAPPPLIDGLRDAAISQDSVERFSQPLHFGRQYRRRLQGLRNLRVLLHATVMEVELHASAAGVAGLLCATPGGARLRVTARAFVLAAGGIETTRLMLASNRVMAPGIGNAHDQLGRHYMTHLAGVFGRFDPAGDARIRHGYWRDAQGVYCRRRLALTPAAQAALGSGNAIARLHHPPPHDPGHGDGLLSALVLARGLITAEYATRLHRGGPGSLVPRARHLANVARRPVSTASRLAGLAAGRWLAARKLPSIVVPPGRLGFAIDLHAEQLPNPASRISLDGARDGLGLPGAAITWQTRAGDARTLAAMAAALAQALGRHGHLAHDPDSIAEEILAQGAYGGHFLGTARMAASPRQGVVDADLRVHGLANLFLCSTATFPSSSQANPTLTLVALALRLAGRLHDWLEHKGG